MSCPICISKYNKSTCAPVKCMCDYVACKTCVRTYMLSVPEPCCMNCRSKWSHEFVKDNLGASFVNHDLKEHQRKVIVERSISRREEMLPRAIMYRDDRADKLKIKEVQKQIEAYKQMIIECYNEIEDIENQIHVRHGRRPRYRDWRREETVEAIAAIAAAQGQAAAQAQGQAAAQAQGQAAAQASTKRFIMPCQKSGCNGMLNQQYNCELCNTSTCSKCLEVLGENHECNPDSVLSATMLKKDTKPCPKCGVRISKIDGCDQMWCVECKTAFSWNTGKIESGKIHNPHYYQFMRERGGMPRDPNDIVGPIRCGNHRDRALDRLFAERGAPRPRSRFVGGYVTNETLPAKKPSPETLAKLDYIINYFQYANHLDRVTIPDLNGYIAGKTNDQTSELLYILGELNKEELADKLIANKKCIEKTQVFHDIYAAINMMIDQLSNDIVDGRNDIGILYDTIVKYSNYFNAELVKALMLYDTKRLIEVFKNDNKETHTYVQYKNKADMMKDLEKYTNPVEPNDNIKIGGGGGK